MIMTDYEINVTSDLTCLQIMTLDCIQCWQKATLNLSISITSMPFTMASECHLVAVQKIRKLQQKKRESYVLKNL